MKEGRKEKEFNSFLIQMALLHWLSRLWYEQTIFKTSGNMWEINGDDQDMTLFYQSVWNWYLLSVCTTGQPATSQTFYPLFSHLGATNWNWQRQMNSTHVFCLITYTQGLLLVHSSLISVRFDGHGLYSARTPIVVVNRHDSETCNENSYTLVILTL